MDLPPRTNPDFRMRSREVSRLEGFSDAVFGFAIALLMVSVEVPRTFDDLLATMRLFPAFAATFTSLVILWHAQYRWFRRYGLDDGASMVLNMMFLFVVLLFVYPLKFVFTLIFEQLLDVDPRVLRDGALVPPLRPEQQVSMMVVYGLGVMAAFGLLALLYAHALRRRKVLELDALEVHDTRHELGEYLVQVGVGLCSILIARATGSAGWAGLTYFLIAPLLTVYGTVSGRRRRPLEAQYK